MSGRRGAKSRGPAVNMRIRLTRHAIAFAVTDGGGPGWRTTIPMQAPNTEEYLAKMAEMQREGWRRAGR